MSDVKVITIASQGLKGATGQTGPQGVGIVGPPGLRGEKGEKGDQGAFGVIDGAGSKNTIPLYVDSTILGDSIIHQYLNALNGQTYLGFNIRLPTAPIHLEYPGNPEDVQIRINSTGGGTPKQLDITTRSLQAYQDNGITAGSLDINPNGGSAVFGGELKIGPGAFEVGTGQVAKLFTSVADGLVVATANAAAYNFVLANPDTIPLIQNPAGTTHLLLVPQSGKIIIGPSLLTFTNSATLEVTGNIHATGGIVTASSITEGEMIIDSGFFTVSGDARVTQYISRIVTTDNTPTDLMIDGISERIPLNDNSAYIYTIDIVARQTDGSNTLMYTLRGGISVLAGVATMREANETVLYQSNANWDFAANVYTNTGINYLQLTAIGDVGATVHWVAYTRVTNVS